MSVVVRIRKVVHDHQVREHDGTHSCERLHILTAHHSTSSLIDFFRSPSQNIKTLKRPRRWRENAVESTALYIAMKMETNLGFVEVIV